VGVLPLIIAGEPTAGTAGEIAILPFTGDMTSALPLCALPTVADGVDVQEEGGGEKVFFVALA
jgi:hypothetical protein